MKCLFLRCSRSSYQNCANCGSPRCVLHLWTDVGVRHTFQQSERAQKEICFECRDKDLFPGTETAQPQVVAEEKPDLSWKAEEEKTDPLGSPIVFQPWYTKYVKP